MSAKDIQRPTAALRRKAVRIDRALEAYYGVPDRRRLDPLSELVLTILSQNTSDINSGRAFERLRARFPTWEAVRDAPLEAIIEAIRPAGLAAQKAPASSGSSSGSARSGVPSPWISWPTGLWRRPRLGFAG